MPSLSSSSIPLRIVATLALPQTQKLLTAATITLRASCGIGLSINGDGWVRLVEIRIEAATEINRDKDTVELS